MITVLFIRANFPSS